MGPLSRSSPRRTRTRRVPNGSRVLSILFFDSFRQMSLTSKSFDSSSSRTPRPRDRQHLPSSSPHELPRRFHLLAAQAPPLRSGSTPSPPLERRDFPIAKHLP